MSQSNNRDFCLKKQATASHCEQCPPERVCAWDCVQGASAADILIGAVLEQSQNWALERTEPGQEATKQALWDTFNS